VDTLRRVFYMTVASLAIWFCVGMVDVATSSSGATNAAAVLAFLCTMSIWLVWGLAQIDQLHMGGSQSSEQEKAKRSPADNGDARVALLLSLLDDDERQALKQRLVDDLGADGEAVPLADLLAEQEENSRQSGV